MKIALVRRRYTLSGGAENYLHRLATGLQSRGHETGIVCESWSGAPDVTGMNIHTLGDCSGPVTFANACNDFFSQNTFDLVFSLERIWKTDLYRAGDGVHREWLTCRARHSHFLQGLFDRFNSKHEELLNLEKALFTPGSARFVIANSKRGANEIASHFKYPREQIAVVYNGVDYEKFSSGNGKDVRKNLGVGHEKFMVLLVGSGWKRKGIAPAIEAMKKLADRVVFVIVGRDKPAGREEPNVIFAGTSSCPEDLYAACDIFLLPSLYEPFSNACLEALAAGKPVITSEINGASEILTSQTGRLIHDPSNSQEIADRVNDLCNRQWLEACHIPCQELARRYSLTRNISETLDIITKLHP